MRIRSTNRCKIRLSDSTLNNVALLRLISSLNHIGSRFICRYHGIYRVRRTRMCNTRLWPKSETSLSQLCQTKCSHSTIRSTLAWHSSTFSSRYSRWFILLLTRLLQKFLARAQEVARVGKYVSYVSVYPLPNRRSRNSEKATHDSNAIEQYNPWPGFHYTGKLRPYPLVTTERVSNSIPWRPLL